MISVVIPTWNEEISLPRALQALREQTEPAEILVADGGSTDRTVELAQAWGVGVVRCSRRQRAAQMNEAAAQACGDILLFLHADTRLPAEALTRVRSALRDPHVAGGAFARRFDSRSLLLRLTCRLAEVRNRTFGWHLGDQAMFARRSAFERAGRFPEFELFEDLELSRRLRAFGRLVTLRPPVVTSARRFKERGPLRTSWRDLVLTLRYRRGEDPNRLAEEVRRGCPLESIVQ